jgi:hypothetical protein
VGFRGDLLGYILASVRRLPPCFVGLSVDSGMRNVDVGVDYGDVDEC